MMLPRTCTWGEVPHIQHFFTGKEHDSESGNDYFEARYYASSMGRFLSPDEPKFSEKTDPQSWNLYSYVGNNPLSKTDPTGHNWFDINGQCMTPKDTTMTHSAACATVVRFPRSRFTGKERDAESGNDYFGARYYASTMGRFMSPILVCMYGAIRRH